MTFKICTGRFQIVLFHELCRILKVLYKMISFNIVALVVLQITAQASEKKNVQKDLIFNFTELLEKVNSFL